MIWLEGRSDALVVDPGLEPELILQFLKERRLEVAAILNTHGHADHIGGNSAMKDAFPQAPIITGANEADLLTDANLNLSAPFGLPIVSPPADQLVREGDVLELAGIRLEVLDIPGHSPGHIVFVQRGEPCRVFSGDVLFRGSVGRTDFPAAAPICSFRAYAPSCFYFRATRCFIPDMVRPPLSIMKSTRTRSSEVFRAECEHQWHFPPKKWMHAAG